MLARLRAFFRTRAGRLVLHDGAIAAATGCASWDAAGHSLTWAAAAAAGVVAAKAFLRFILPVPAASDKPGNNIPANIPANVTSTVRGRLKLLPAQAGRKGGALPSPVDERDWKAALARISTLPATCDFGAGIHFGMLLNDRISDCYPAALLHALQVLTGGKFTPTDADVLHVYEQVTGYDPSKTQPDGSNPTDQGTYGRQLFAWARARGLIKSYAAVPADRLSVRRAIAEHKAVLCEWALPTGVEYEGDVWTMPRAGRAAGSWGYHATVEVGYTSRRNRNVTWGEEGTVTPPFEDAYLVAAWVVEAPATIPML